MNLLNDSWLPFRTRGGAIVYRPPSAVADPKIVDLALPRADFQGAAYQFLIGLLQTVLPPADHGDWLDRFIEPPGVADLEAAFAPFATAFELDGDGPRFMQDLDPLEGTDPSSVSGLLIDSPATHFVKPGTVGVLCGKCSALALFNIQANAPSGGRGHRVGLRGGGPLTTLVMPDYPEETLWIRLWINVTVSQKITRTGQVWKIPSSDNTDLFFLDGAHPCQ